MNKYPDSPACKCSSFEPPPDNEDVTETMLKDYLADLAEKWAAAGRWGGTVSRLGGRGSVGGGLKTAHFNLQCNS
jgi:hypothetical protein